jgi:hypothetical protein
MHELKLTEKHNARTGILSLVNTTLYWESLLPGAVQTKCFKNGHKLWRTNKALLCSEPPSLESNPLVIEVWYIGRGNGAAFEAVSFAHAR